MPTPDQHACACANLAEFGIVVSHDSLIHEAAEEMLAGGLLDQLTLHEAWQKFRAEMEKPYDPSLGMTAVAYIESLLYPANAA